MSSKIYKMGIVGFGGMAGWHRETIETIDGLEIAGVFDINPERLKIARDFGLMTYVSIEDLLADAQIDFILIATPNDKHKDIAVQAMEAGKHVVCEKPVTLSSRDLLEMTDASRRTGCFLTVHQNRRWDEDFLTVKQILDSGKLGELYRIESRVHGSRGIPGDWRQEKEFGGGMVLDWGVHLFDQILLIMGEVACTHVYATLTNVTNQIVDDGFSVELTFANGVVAFVEVGTSNFISLPRWYVLGQDGTAIIEDWDMKGKITCANGKSEEDVIPIRTAAGLTKTMAPRREDSIFTEELPKVESDIREFYQNVMEVIAGKTESKILLPEVARVMRLMECVFESAEKKEVICFE